MSPKSVTTPPRPVTTPSQVAMATNNAVGNHVDEDVPLVNEVEEMDTIEGLYALSNIPRNIRARVHT